MKIRNSIAVLKEEISAYRHSMHENPGTAYEEKFASELVSRKLKEWGIEFESNIAVTGIVAKIEGRSNMSGKSIGLRADMDALDIVERSGQPWSSKIEGKMHACGHDGHTSLLLGAAKYLQETRNFDGTVYFIFQPAEEGRGGADRMIQEGLFEKFQIDVVFGLHNWPFLERGKAALRNGPMLASANEFTVKVTGKGGHAAFPEKTKDPIITASKMILAIQTIISRELKPTNPAVISITNFNAGTGAFNVIPDEAEFRGTFRVFTPETKEFVQRRIDEICSSIAEAFGLKVSVEFGDAIPPTINTKAETDLCASILRDILGSENVDTDVELCMGSEDFGSMLLNRPGAYIFLGQAERDNLSPHNQSLHAPNYDFNDEIIPLGIEYFVKIAETYLESENK